MVHGNKVSLDIHTGAKFTSRADDKPDFCLVHFFKHLYALLVILRVMDKGDFLRLVLTAFNEFLLDILINGEFTVIFWGIGIAEHYLCGFRVLAVDFKDSFYARFIFEPS